MFDDECVLGVRAQFFHYILAEKKGYQKEQSRLSTTGGHSVRAVVNVHVVNSERMAPSVVPSTLRTSVCYVQLMSIGEEMALSRNTQASK